MRAPIMSASNYRGAYAYFAYSGILCNHEFPIRPERFVTSKIVFTAIRIANGYPRKFRLSTLLFASA
jgi:GDPmannose 4,6-dehydratase